MASKWLVISSLVLVGLASADLGLDELLSPNTDLAVVWDDQNDMEDRSPSLRVVNAPVSANRVVDVMINRMIKLLNKRNWQSRRTMPSLRGSVPFNTDSGQSSITVDISNGALTNLGSVRRGRAAFFNTNKHILYGTLNFYNMRLSSNYNINSPAVGQAPSARASGTFSSDAATFFVDFSFLVDSQGLPLALRSWRPRPGNVRYRGSTGMSSGFKFRSAFEAILKDSGRSLIERVIRDDMFKFTNAVVSGKLRYQ